jgi:hypothetical protein
MTPAHPVGAARRLALAILATLLGAVPAFAQAPADAAHRFAYETHVFRRLLKDQHLHPENLGVIKAHPSESLLIVLGKTDFLNRDNLPEGLAAFVAQGGAVLIATDRAPGFEAPQEMLRQAAGVQVLGQPVLGPDTAAALYRDKAFCPFLIPVRDAEPNLFRGPRLDPTARLRVATNVPTWLRVFEPGLPAGVHRLAMLPPGSSPEPPPRGAPGLLNRVPWEHLRDAFARAFPANGERGPLFAVGGTRGDGRILVLADHSIFINQMMLPTDNDNVEFTYNALEWLRDHKQRTRVLLVQDGVVRTDLDVPLKEVALPPEVIAAAADEVLANLEHEDAFNRKLLEWLEGRSGNNPDRIARWALEALTVLVLLYAAYRVLIRGRHRLETAVPLLAHAAAGHTPAAPLLEQRYQAARRAGNHWETAHHLARQWFATLAPAAAGPRPPTSPSAAAGGAASGCAAVSPGCGGWPRPPNRPPSAHAACAACWANWSN